MADKLTFSIGHITLTGLLSLLGIFIGYRLNIYRDRRNELKKAGESFRNEFVETLCLLNIHHPNHPGGKEFDYTFKLLPKFYNQQHSAFIRFEPYLPWHEKGRFTRCWHQYCCFDKQHNKPTFSDYECGVDHDIELTKRKLAITRINKMFKHTF